MKNKDNNKIRYLRLIGPKKKLVFTKKAVSDVHESWKKEMKEYGLDSGEKRDFWQELADERGEESLALTDLDVTLGDYMTAYICAFTDLSRQEYLHSQEDILDTYDCHLMALELVRKEELLFCNN